MGYGEPKQVDLGLAHLQQVQTTCHSTLFDRSFLISRQGSSGLCLWAVERQT